MNSSLLDFARVNDAAAATRGKLEKQSILAEYFRSLDDGDLRRAVRYAAGRAFPRTDGRVLSVAGAIISDVALELLGIDAEAYHDAVIAGGEIGEALAALWPDGRIARGRGNIAGGDIGGQDIFSTSLMARDAEGKPPGLSDLAEAFDELAATGNIEIKRDILRRLFARCASGREAAYVAKIMLGDLRTGVQEGVLQAAIARAFEKPLADIQRGQLLIGDLDEVAVLAHHDALATAGFRLFHPIQFMLATPRETAEMAAETLGGRAFLVEDKLDGIRAQIHKRAGGRSDDGARVAIYTRTMDRIEAAFPDVAAAMARLPGEFLLDGEIVPWRDGRVLPFAHIQRRLGRKKVSAKILAENPAVFIAFDILYRDGRLLMDEPLRTRRKFLAQLAENAHRAGMASAGVAALLISEPREISTAAEIADFFEAARGRRNEGIVLKDPESIYSPGRRGGMWLKLKTHLPTIDCVVTGAETGHGKRRDSLSDYTFAVWKGEPGAGGTTGAELVNIGKAFSGVSDEEIAKLTELFTRSTLRQMGRLRIVEPRVVLEIACDQIQKSERHSSGYALRFPRIKRIRWDKRAADADRLSRVIEIYESQANFARREAAEAAPAAEPTLFDELE